MSEVVIQAENLGKCYQLNHQAGGQGYRRFSESLIYAAKAPLRWLQKPAHTSSSEQATTEEFWALKDLNFEIKRGEVVGIIGRNGAGKSTLLKVLSRITEPTTGRITLRGRVASLLEVGTGFHPELTGRENIFLNGAILGMTKTEIYSKFDEIVAFAEVEKFLDTPVKRYSSGMYVRLAFAVAAHLEPEILIIDEVLAVGDAQFQKKCLGKMQDVATGGRTVLFVSHNMGTVCAICSRAILMERGVLKLDGPSNTVINDYLARREAQASTRDPRARLKRLDDNLDLLAVDLDKPVIASGEGLNVEIRIRAHQAPARLVLGLQLVSAAGIRLVEWDLRHPSLVCEAAPGRDAVVSVAIPSLPLVEGDYQFSLFHQAASSQGDHAALADLTVIPSAEPKLVPPVPAAYRGFFEIPCQFSYRSDHASL